MHGLEICIADDNDQDAIRTATLAAYAEFASALGATDWTAYRQNIVQVLRNVGNAEQLVARQRDEVVGTVMLCAPGSAFTGHVLAGESPEVRLLAVTPVARGKGIAAALMSECIKRARSDGATSITLHTMDAMSAARRLYSRMGFRRAPELDFRPRENIFAQGYCLELADT